MSVSEWIVLLDADGEPPMAYGPFADEEAAHDLAEYFTAEVDTARVICLASPVRELLHWWRGRRDRETRPLVAEGQWPPKLGDVWQDKRGSRWLAVPGAQLLHLGQRDGAAPYDEIWRLFGPLALVSRPDIEEKEPPF